jgi:hypothetical protein
MLGLTLSGLGLADYLGAAITPAVYAAAALLVVGLALVLATWLGHSRRTRPVRRWSWAPGPPPVGYTRHPCGLHHAG